MSKKDSALSDMPNHLTAADMGHEFRKAKQFLAWFDKWVRKSPGWKAIAAHLQSHECVWLVNRGANLRGVELKKYDYEPTKELLHLHIGWICEGDDGWESREQKLPVPAALIFHYSEEGLGQFIASQTANAEKELAKFVDAWIDANPKLLWMMKLAVERRIEDRRLAA